MSLVRSIADRLRRLVITCYEPDPGCAGFMDRAATQHAAAAAVTVAVLAAAEAEMRRPMPLEAPTRLIQAQERARDRLVDLAVFWRRLVAAWQAVDPHTTDRREIESLARNATRRLALSTLYRPAME
jgi:hypothetical protein